MMMATVGGPAWRAVVGGGGGIGVGRARGVAVGGCVGLWLVFEVVFVFNRFPPPLTVARHCLCCTGLGLGV